MTIHETEDFIKTITYKPNVQIEFIYDLVGKFPAIVFRAKVKDVNDPSTVIEIRSVEPIHRFDWDKEHLIFLIEHGLKSLEIHELYEWFKIDGKQVYPQH